MLPGDCLLLAATYGLLRTDRLLQAASRWLLLAVHHLLAYLAVAGWLLAVYRCLMTTTCRLLAIGCHPTPIARLRLHVGYWPRVGGCCRLAIARCLLRTGC